MPTSRGQLQSLRLSFNYFATGMYASYSFYFARCVYIYIVPRADFKFCSTKRKSWNVFTGASLFTGLLREILFLLFPSPVRVTIRSYEIAVFPSCSEEKRYIFETIIFIRSKYEPLALMTFSQRDTSIDIFHFYKTLWLQWEEILRIQFLEYFIFLKPKRRSDNRNV